VGVDQHAQHAQRLVVLDKTDATHVGGQLIDAGRARGRGQAVLPVLQVQHKIFHPVGHLVPLRQRLDVHSANHIHALRDQVLDQMSADKPPAPQTIARSLFRLIPAPVIPSIHSDASAGILETIPAIRLWNFVK